ncbi:MAG: hypothetical protein K8J08_06540, partial [Thermoanaerobaculia bacterium]|nr:hypothetical protein [Thermoanaerobaculia bacterium]
MSRRTPSKAVSLLVGVAVVALVTLAASPLQAQTPVASGSTGSGTFSFFLSAFNRTYSDVVPEDLAAVTSGPLVVQPRVPSSLLEIRQHRVDLRPIEPGLFDAVLEVTIAGSGILIAELSLFGPSTILSDLVTLPVQTLRIPSRIQLELRSDGLTVTPLTLPSAIEVRIESAVIGQLIGSCESLTTFLPVSCDAAAVSLSRLQVPLADPGTTYLVPLAALDETTRRALGSLLGE